MRRYAGRYIVAGAILLVSALVAAIQFGGASPVVALEETRIPPDGPEQLPLIYVHGYNDDGASWGESTGPYWDALRDVTEGSGNPLTTPVENYAVQFGTSDRDPFANADEGWAVLHTPAQMALPPLEAAVPGGGYNAYNSPDPVAYFLENKHLLLKLFPECEVYLPLPDNCYIPAVEFVNELSERRVRSNYNRNGRAEYHAEDLKEMLRREFGGGGKFADLRQVNIITHSAGGIDTRALLALLKRSDYRTEQERVANVMFTAPPFGGSTIAEVANIIYDDDLNTTVVTNPWFAAVVANQVEPPIKVFLRSMIQMRPANILTDQQVNETIDLFADAARLLGHDLLSYGHGASALLVEAIRLVRPVVSDLFGFPGTPKVDVDLRPSGAITNLRDWERNPHTMQFVTWGEAGVFGIGYNLSPDLADIADDNYGTIDDITVSGYLKAFPGDTALSNVSARTLTTDAPGGWMVPLQSYDLTHGDLIVDTFETGAKWIEALMAPVTTLRVIGAVKVVDRSDRYYVVSPDFTFDFLPEARTFRDQWGNQITVRPPTDSGTGGVQYRVVSYPGGGGPVYEEWQDLDVTLSAAVYETQDVSFSDLESHFRREAIPSPVALDQQAGRPRGDPVGLVPHRWQATYG